MTGRGPRGMKRPVAHVETAIAQGTGLAPGISVFVPRGGPVSVATVPFFVATAHCRCDGVARYVFDDTPGPGGVGVALLTLYRSVDGGVTGIHIAQWSTGEATIGGRLIAPVAMAPGDLLALDCTLPAASPATILTFALPIRFDAD